MAKFGGRQPGAGRPKGSKDTRTQMLLERAAAEGISPVEVLLNDMRFFYNIGEQEMQNVMAMPPGTSKQKAFIKASALKEIARSCARDAAPYVHPKLASIQANVNVNNVEAKLAELE